MEKKRPSRTSVAARATSKTAGADVKGHTLGGMATEDNKGAQLTSPEELLTISEDHRMQLRQAFDIFDSSGVGRIPAQDVKVALYALGYDVDQIELQHLLRGANVAAGIHDTVDFNDFFHVIVRKMTRKESRQECVRAFKRIDKDDKGGINLVDLREISNSLNLHLTDDELIEMMLFAHQGNATATASDFDGRDSIQISEEDYLKLMRRANVY